MTTPPQRVRNRKTRGKSSEKLTSPSTAQEAYVVHVVVAEDLTAALADIDFACSPSSVRRYDGRGGLHLPRLHPMSVALASPTWELCAQTTILARHESA